MTGFTNFSGDNLLNYTTGQVPMPTLPGVFLALFTAVGTDAGTGFTEASGGGYARVQVAGALAAGASFTTASTSITLGATAPAWLLALGTSGAPGAGASIYDETTGQLVGTVASISGTTVTLSGTAAHNSSGATDTLTFSAFGPATGTAPSTCTSVAAVNFPQATGSGWGTSIAFGLYDTLTGGNLTNWDFLGAFNWLPFEMPTASGTVTAKANGLSNNDPIVFTAEYGGTLPTLSTGVMTGYTISFAGSVATDTFVPNTTSGPTTPFVSTSSGSGNFRKIVQQLIPANITPQFAAGTLVLSAA